MWDNPRKVGTPYVDENNETIFAGPLLGRRFFARLEQIQSRDFIKGKNAVFVFSFQGRLIKLFLLLNLIVTVLIKNTTTNMFEMCKSLYTFVKLCSFARSHSSG